MRKLIFILLFIPSLAFGTNYYVKTGGSDLAAGTSDGAAWATIGKVNTVWAAGTFAPGDSILFNRGDSFTGTLSPTENGTLANRIVVGAYGTGDKPIFTGLTTITSWTNEGSGIYSKVISPESAPNLVTVNGVNTAMGRYPNSGWLYYESYSSNVSITDNALTGTPSYIGAGLLIGKNAWTLERGTVTNQVTTTLTYSGGGSSGSNGMGYFFQNSLTLLDALGEWYYDAAATKLYMYFGAVDPTTKLVKVVTQDKLINVHDYWYITFLNLSLQGSNLYSVYLDYAYYATLLNCDINYSGDYAIYAVTTARMTVDGCTINNTNNNAIDLQGIYCTNSTITNNTIDSTGILPGGVKRAASCTAISLWSDNSLVQYNTITATGYIGIFFRANNITVDGNLVTYCGQTKDDGGGIYTSSSAYTGNTVTNNGVFYGGVGGSVATSYGYRAIHGIYIDQNGGGVTIKYNTTAHNAYSGIYFHNSDNNTLISNTAYNNTIAQLYMAYDAGLDYIRGLVIDSNYFVAKASSQYSLYFKYWDANGATYGTSDHNYFARPIDDDYVFYFYPSTGGSEFRTLAQWRTLTSQDANSFISPLSVADSTKIDFYYNYTAAPVVQAVTDMIDLAGTKYAASYTIPAWSSVVLLTDPDPDPDPPDPPVVTTSTDTSKVWSKGATLGGNVTDDGGGTVSTRGVCYSTTPSPTTASSKVASSGTTGAYTVKINGLSVNTIYYARAYVTTEIATVYGAEISFTTPSVSILHSGEYKIFSGDIVIMEW